MHACFDSELSREEHTDLNIICNDEKFSVHKVILASRSDVFATMFRHNDTEEAATKELKIVDTDATTLKHFLR